VGTKLLMEGVRRNNWTKFRCIAWSVYLLTHVLGYSMDTSERETRTKMIK